MPHAKAVYRKSLCVMCRMRAGVRIKITENKLSVNAIKKRIVCTISLCDEYTVDVYTVFDDVVLVFPVANNVIPTIFGWRN